MTLAQTKTYIFYEIGDSCVTEFKMHDGKFHPTEDAVVIGISEGRSYQDAFKRLMRKDSWVKEYCTDRIEAREVGTALYL